MTLQELALHYWEAINAPVDGWNRSTHPKTHEFSDSIYRRGVREFGTEDWEAAVTGARRRDDRP